MEFLPFFFFLINILKTVFFFFLFFPNYKQKVYLENHRGRRSEPYRKWVQETNYKGKRRGPLELREKGNGNGPGEKKI